MKKHGILLAGALSVVAGAAYAAMGPQWGLPQNWTTTAAQGYGAVALTDGNGASSMCVECHTVNPSALIRDVESNGALTVDRTNAAHRGSHFVINDQATSGANNPWGSTASGGGFTGGFGGVNENGKYFRNGAWTSGATSKFGSGTDLTSVVEGGAGYGDGTADMICESCHNVVVNAVTAADNDLLVGTYQDNVNDGICLGCHTGGATETSGAVAGYTAFHGNDNLPAFAGNTVRKRHHVLTGDTLADANYLQGNNSIMWAPSASNRLDANWCPGATPGPYGTLSPSINLDLAAGAAIAFRGACNVAGQGSRASGAPAGLGDIVAQGAAAINCSNCHRPHNAMASTGAFILRYGGGTAATDFGGLVGGGQFSGITNASVYYGIRRQSDVDSSYATKIYGDYRPLCAGCHYGY